MVNFCPFGFGKRLSETFFIYIFLSQLKKKMILMVNYQVTYLNFIYIYIYICVCVCVCFSVK
jgi:hypothetical protein